jgi:ketosteroid isomerase-like protein
VLLPPARPEPRVDPAPPVSPPAAPPTAPSAARPTPPATTPAAPDTSADKQQIDAAVRRYFAARSSLDFAAIQQVYPAVPARERDNLRRTEGACSDFAERATGVTVLSVTGEEAVVRARAQTTCRMKAGGQQVTSPEVEVFITMKKAGGAWQIALVNRPDQAR